MLALKVTGYAGGAIVIKSQYDDKYHQNKKYFCKHKYRLSCENLIMTEFKNEWANAGRFSLYDNTTGRFFMVIFRDLTPDDAGKYYCAVDKEWSFDKYTDVDLNISPGENEFILYCIYAIFSLATLKMHKGNFVCLFCCFSLLFGSLRLIA